MAYERLFASGEGRAKQRCGGGGGVEESSS